MSRAGTRLGPEAGVTLIELLVAVTLVGLLSVGSLMTLDIAAEAWRETRAALTFDRRVVVANGLLHAQFAGLAPVPARPRPSVGAPEFPFFDGEPNQMRFVSSYSWTAGPRGGLRIVELSLGETERGLRLILTESPYQGPLSAGRFVVGMDRGEAGRVIVRFSPVVPRADSLIVADELASCRFSYFRERRFPGDEPRWVEVWDNPQQVPAAIRVNLEPREPGPRLKPTSITAEVRARYGRLDTGPTMNIDPRRAEIVDTPHGTVLRERRP